MLNIKKYILAVFLITGSTLSYSIEHDVLLEAKGSIFVPTDETFRDIYGNCGVFQVEMTTKLFKELYNFTSVGVLLKHGNTVELDTPTKLSMINIGFGLKGFVPFNHGNFYVGLGILPTYIKIENDVNDALITNTNWNCGGVGKIGLLVDLGRSAFVDLFFDYNFVKSTFYSSNPTQANISHFDGCLFGLGFGYKFD